MTPSIPSPPTRGVAELGWSLSGPNTVLIATCVCGVGSTSSKISRPRSSNAAFRRSRTSGSPRLSTEAPATRAPKVRSPRMVRTVTGVMATSSRLIPSPIDADRPVGPLDQLRDQQGPANEQRALLLDGGSALVPLVVTPRWLDQLGA